MRVRAVAANPKTPFLIAMLDPAETSCAQQLIGIRDRAERLARQATSDTST
jgi:hypothetical protein